MSHVFGVKNRTGGRVMLAGVRGRRGAQVVGSTFDEDGRLIMTLDDGSMVASDPSPVVETVIEATDTAVAAAGESVSASNAAAEARNEALAASVTAGEKADQSANSASEAAASEAVATAKAFEAEDAADRAETARDAAFVNADVYPDVATGRAAVADGEQFQVVEGDEIVRYRRDSASTQTEVSRIVSSVGFRPVELSANRASALSGGYPIAASASVADAGGNRDLLNQILSAVTDVRLFGLSDSDSYYIERIRRNYSGNWHIVIKRSSDNASVLQFFGPLTEPEDPYATMFIKMTALVAGVSGTAAVRWGALVSGVANSGLTIPLSNNSLVVDHPSFLNTMPAYGARFGQVPIVASPADFVVADESAMTFTWPTVNIVAGEANPSARYRLLGGSVSFSGTRQEVAWLDLRLAAAQGLSDVPASAVRVGTYTNTSARTSDDYVAEPYQLPLAWSPGSGRIDVSPMLRTAPATPTPVDGYGGAASIYRDLTNNEVTVYYPATTRRDSDKYIRVRLLHWVTADADAWTIGGIWEAQRTGYESYTTGKRLIVENTEILAAFQEQGAADFMGSRAHGDEVIVEAPTLLIDGKEVSMVSGASGWYHGDTVTLIQRTRMYRVGSALSVPLIERGLILEFRDMAIYADQRFTFLDDFSMSNGYAAMLAPHRYETYQGGVSEDTGSAQISGKYIHNNAFTPKDISARQSAADPVEDYSQPTPRVNHVKMWGTYGVEFELEVIEASDILKDIFFIQRNNYAYNKAYIGFIGGYSGIQTVSTGDQWAIKTRMSIRSSN